MRASCGGWEASADRGVREKKAGTGFAAAVGDPIEWVCLGRACGVSSSAAVDERKAVRRWRG